MIILRTSERSAYKRCVAKWWWAYREGLKPKGAEKTPLWFGTGVHLALAEWYLPGTKRGPHPSETFANFAGDAVTAIKVADATEDQVAEYVDGKELGIKMLEGYVQRYGRDEQWSFISAEQAFQLPVPWPKRAENRQGIWDVDDDETMLTYAGTFDGVYRDLGTGRIELLETKTAKAIMTSHLSLDDQAGSYWAVASHVLAAQGLIKPGERISAINYNFLRKALPDERPRDVEGYCTNKPTKAHYQAVLGDYALKSDKMEDLQRKADEFGYTVLGERSKQQPMPLFQRELVNRTTAERRTQLRRIQDESLHMRAVREGLLPIIKAPTRNCDWDCDFVTMCKLQDAGGDWKTHREAAYRVEDPYADHRKSTDE